MSRQHKDEKPLSEAVRGDSEKQCSNRARNALHDDPQAGQPTHPSKLPDQAGTQHLAPALAEIVEAWETLPEALRQGNRSHGRGCLSELLDRLIGKPVSETVTASMGAGAEDGQTVFQVVMPQPRERV